MKKSLSNQKSEALRSLFQALKSSFVYGKTWRETNALKPLSNLARGNAVDLNHTFLNLYIEKKKKTTAARKKAAGCENVTRGKIALFLFYISFINLLRGA